MSCSTQELTAPRLLEAVICAKKTFRIAFSRMDAVQANLKQFLQQIMNSQTEETGLVEARILMGEALQEVEEEIRSCPNMDSVKEAELKAKVQPYLGGDQALVMRFAELLRILKEKLGNEK